MNILFAIGRWIGAHTSKLAIAGRQTALAAVALGFVHYNETQLAIIGMAASAILDLFVESQTVSKVRMGERVQEVEAKIEEKVEAKVAQREMAGTTGTGVGLAPVTVAPTATTPNPPTTPGM